MFILSFLRKNIKFRAQRNSAFRVLTAIRNGTCEDDPIPWIESNLQHSDWEIRNVAVKIIGLCNLTKFTENLISMVTSKQEPGFIRRNGLISLRQLSPCNAAVSKTARQALEDDYWEVRTEAANWLYHHGQPDPELSDFIIKRIYRKNPLQLVSYPVFWPKRIYNEKNFEVRAAMMLALGSVLDSPSKLNALQIPLREDLWKVREAALIGYTNASHRLNIPWGTVTDSLKFFDLTCTECKPTFPIRQTFNKLSEEHNPSNQEKV